MEMKKYKLGDILVNHDRRRIPLSSKVRSGRKGNFRYYGAQGVVDYIDDYIFDGEYVLIAEDGENLRSRNQNVANLVSGQFWVNNHAHIVTTNEKCDLHYFYYAFNFLQIDGYISGSAQPKLSQDSLNRIEMTIPDLQTQKGIASFLFTIDKRIENLRAQNRVLEQTAKTIYDYTFLQCAGHQTTYNKTLNRNIPVDWEVKKLGDLLTIKNGKDHKHLKDGPFAVYGSGGLMRKVDSFLYDGESVLIPRKGTLNNVMYVDEKFWTVDTMFYSVMNEPYYGKYVYYSVKDIDFMARNSGTGVPSMTSGYLNTISIALPDSQTLETFNNQVTPLFKKVQLNTKQIEALTTQRNTLLPLLMTGQIEIG